MFDRISFERLLEVTAEDLDAIRNNLGVVYMDETISSDVKYVALAQAFSTIDSWSKYFNRYKDIQDSKIEELNNENVSLASENKRLNDELKCLKNMCIEQSEKLGLMQGKLEMVNEVIKAKNNSSNMIQVDLVEMIEKLENITNNYESAIKNAEHKAAMKTFNKRVASGEVKPAKRADVDDEYIIKMVNDDVSAYKIAQSVGMTQQAILYRIKKLKEAGLL